MPCARRSRARRLAATSQAWRNHATASNADAPDRAVAKKCHNRLLVLRDGGVAQEQAKTGEQKMITHSLMLKPNTAYANTKAFWPARYCCDRSATSPRLRFRHCFLRVQGSLFERRNLGEVALRSPRFFFRVSIHPAKSILASKCKARLACDAPDRMLPSARNRQRAYIGERVMESYAR